MQKWYRISIWSDRLIWDHKCIEAAMAAQNYFVLRHSIYNLHVPLQISRKMLDCLDGNISLARASWQIHDRIFFYAFL